MAEITESAVRKVLEAVIDPATAKNVVAQGMVGGIAVRGGQAATTTPYTRGPRPTSTENLMLTGDENIVDIGWFRASQWRRAGHFVSRLNPSALNLAQEHHVVRRTYRRV